MPVTSGHAASRRLQPLARGTGHRLEGRLALLPASAFARRTPRSALRSAHGRDASSASRTAGRRVFCLTFPIAQRDAADWRGSLPASGSMGRDWCGGLPRQMPRRCPGPWPPLAGTVPRNGAARSPVGLGVLAWAPVTSVGMWVSCPLRRCPRPRPGTTGAPGPVSRWCISPPAVTGARSRGGRPRSRTALPG